MKKNGSSEKIEQLKQEIKEIQWQILQAHVKISKLDSSNKKLTDRIEELISTDKTFAENLDLYNFDYISEEYTQQLYQQKYKNDAIMEQIEEIEEKIKHSQEEVDKYKKLCEEYEKRKQAIDFESVRNEEKRNQDEINRLKNYIKELDAKINKEKVRLESLSNMNVELAKEDSSENIDNYKYGQIVHDIGTLSDEIRATSESIDQMTQELKYLEKANATADEMIEDMKPPDMSIYDNYVDPQKYLKELMEEIQEIEKNANEFSKKAEIAEKKNEKSEKHFDYLKSLTTKRIPIAKYVSQYKSVHELKKEYEAILSLDEETLKKQKQELEVRINKNRTLQGRIKRLMEEIEINSGYLRHETTKLYEEIEMNKEKNFDEENDLITKICAYKKKLKHEKVKKRRKMILRKNEAEDYTGETEESSEDVTDNDQYMNQGPKRPRYPKKKYNVKEKSE